MSNEALKHMIERIERLEEEKSAIADDIKAVYAQAKAEGYDPRVMRQVIAARKNGENETREQMTLLEVYLSAMNGGENE